MNTHPPDPWFAHPLLAAPHFVGRAEELDALRALWEGGFPGVVALIGLGGAGKTAVAARFLGELALGALPQPHGLFVWSFYQEPDAGLFLREAHRYFAGDPPPAARGAGLLHLLRERLAALGPNLLVLDGLERVQREGGPGRPHGQVEDPLLKGLLTRAAEGLGATTVLVTSRFPLTDLGPQRDRGYRQLDVGGLAPAAALDLLRRRGVCGDDVDLAALVEHYGAHALTLDHLGGLLGQFLGGDPRRAPEAPALAAPGSDRQALRLARLLRAYEEHLPAAELALLCRLCLLRRSAREEDLRQLFLCAPPVRPRTARELVERIPRLPGADSYPASMSDLAAAVQGCIEEALCAAPLAGPEELFRQEVQLAAENVLGVMQRGLDADFEELQRLYAGAEGDAPTDERPLPPSDRYRLRALCERYARLSRHPLSPFAETEQVVQDAFLAAFAASAQGPAAQPGDLLPVDIVRGRKSALRDLRYLTGKHFALRRVRELCRLYQRKWALAGALAPLDAGGLRQALEGLVGRHLVLREGDGSFSVHPAVRDHFGRLVGAEERGGWHDLIREQLISLSQRPGRRLPEDPAALDLVEEAVHHALAAGRPHEALALYEQALGGLRHLGWRLGETNRGLRILRGFEPCPDRWALGWYLRALGELDEAFAHNDLPFFRADIRLLQGRLAEVEAVGDSARAAVAAFLMGRTRALPPDVLACAVPREQLLLLLGRLDRMGRAADLQELYGDIGWGGESARYRLLLAEVALRQGDADACRGHLQDASTWILRSGSVEHLCLMHLMRARLAGRVAGDPQAARTALDEGLHLARQSGLGLYLIDLLCEQARLALGEGDARAAESAGRAAWETAAAPACGFIWGGTQAAHLVGQALAAQRRSADARAALAWALEERRRLGDPRAAETEALLARV
jgi:hypothetical protein